MKLILVRSIPGGGKSTFAKTKFPGIFHIENDMFHMKNGKYEFNYANQTNAVNWCKDMCYNAIQHGMDCIVTNTFTRKRYIEPYKAIAEKFNAEFIVYRMHGNFQNTHAVPESVLKNMQDNFEDWHGEIHVTPLPVKNGENFLYSFSNI